LQQLYPTATPVADPLAIYERVAFPEPPPDRPHVFVNMVSSVDGRAQVDGRAAGLGSDVDQALMQRLRALADCVLNGSGTVNAEQIYRALPAELIAQRRARGQAEEPLWAVITASGEIRPDSSLFRKPGPRPIVFVAESTPADRAAWLAERADVVVAGRERPDLATVLRTLRERYGCRNVLSEGGPSLNDSMLRADALDELFLTFAPKIAAGEGKNVVEGEQFPKGALPRLGIVSIYEHEDELFFRYRVERG
jgi:2,5-diamino-6-(ribosylamino)-4(3H)-pyrimidinone 5'-phosphate reductase